MKKALFWWRLVSPAAWLALLFLVPVVGEARDQGVIEWIKSPRVFGESAAAYSVSRTDAHGLILYREKGVNGSSPVAALGAPLNIYINEQYHASLLPGGYAPLWLCESQAKVSGALRDADRGHSARHSTAQLFGNLTPGALSYIEVSIDSNGLLKTRQSTHEEFVERAAEGAQVHTRSRVNTQCADWVVSK